MQEIETTGETQDTPAEATLLGAADEQASQGQRVTKVGRVVSDKMDKTVVVTVDYLKAHPLYRKIIRKTNRFHAHDEHNECRIGDTVRIVETRPLSKTKRWRVVSILERGEGA